MMEDELRVGLGAASQRAKSRELWNLAKFSYVVA